MWKRPRSIHRSTCPATLSATATPRMIPIQCSVWPEASCHQRSAAPSTMPHAAPKTFITLLTRRSLAHPVLVPGSLRTERRLWPVLSTDVRNPPPGRGGPASGTRSCAAWHPDSADPEAGGPASRSGLGSAFEIVIPAHRVRAAPWLRCRPHRYNSSGIASAFRLARGCLDAAH